MTFAMALVLWIALVLQVTNEPGGGVHALAWEVQGAGLHDGLGTSIASGHDLNGDGAPDVAIAAQANYVLLASGSDGTEIYRIHAPTGYAIPRSCSLIGDSDSDGVSEVAVMWRLGNRLCLYSGRSGALLWCMDFLTPNYGSSLCGIGDVDGDGLADLVAHSFNLRDPMTGESGGAEILSGADGALIRTHYLTDYWTISLLDHRIADAGDLDADGVHDLALAGATAYNGRGVVALYSGKSGSLIRQLSSPLYWSWNFGEAVANAGDCNEDGIPDLAITETGADIDLGAVHLFDGATGAALWSFSGELPYDNFGDSVAAGYDANGDGCGEIIVGSVEFDNNRGALYLLSGREGALLQRLRSDPGVSWIGFGQHVAWVGDVDSNGSPEYCWLEVGWASSRGRVRCGTWYDGLRLDRNAISTRIGGRSHLALSFPPTSAGSSFALLASNGGGPTSVGGVLIPLTDDALLRRTLAQPPQWLTGGRGRLDALGRASASIDLPAGIWSHRAGSTIYFAAVIGTPGVPMISSVARAVLLLP